MEFVEIGSIVEGDRIRWSFPQIGNEMPPVYSARVYKVHGWGHSVTYDAPYIDFFEFQTFVRRAIALPFVTHHNGRRVDRRYWAGRLPQLDLLRQHSSSNGKGKILSAAQLRIPLTEEDALALKTSTRKSLDEMSESHRAHIEKWEPHVEAMGAEHVWASANRFAGRSGEGLVYAAVKRGSKDYAIVDYNTETKKKAKVLADGFESSKTVMEAFKEYRAMAKEERAASKPAKPAAKKTAAKRPAAKKAPAKKPTTKKKPVRKTVPKK